MANHIQGDYPGLAPPPKSPRGGLKETVDLLEVPLWGI